MKKTILLTNLNRGIHIYIHTRTHTYLSKFNAAATAKRQQKVRRFSEKS